MSLHVPLHQWPLPPFYSAFYGVIALEKACVRHMLIHWIACAGGLLVLGRALLMGALVSMQVMDEVGNFRADNFERLRPDPPPAGDNAPSASGRGADLGNRGGGRGRRG